VTTKLRKLLARVLLGLFVEKRAIDMYDLQSSLADHGIIFCYNGYMSEPILAGIGEAVRTKLAAEEISKQISRSLFSIFVELMQNIIRYSADFIPDEESDTKETDFRYGIIMVGRQEDQFFVSCGNKIAVESVAKLKTNLAQLKMLDKDGLKKLHKETLRGDVPEGSKGAGVGFIDIARRANNGFEFDFRDIDSEYAFFTLKAYV
jgi:hypothetical protein